MRNAAASTITELATHRREHTVCRACHANCSLIMEFEGDKVVNVIGDKHNPVSFGFSCVKGRTMADYHRLPSRLLTSQKRVGNKFEPTGSAQAIDEIAAKLEAIIAEHGPRSVAAFCGTFGYLNIQASMFLKSFLEAIGSKMFFDSATIDQPGKFVAYALHGPWLAGCRRNSEEVDVAIVIGQNQVVALSGAFGLAPAHNIVEGKKRGMKLIVVDPRRSETAHHADLHLQCQPGEDPAIVAGMIRVVLSEGIYDKAFVASEADGIEALRTAVEPFTPDVVATRAGIAANDLIAAARMFAAGNKGMLVCGTGPNMSPRGALTEYLGRCLVTLCGHWPRAGEPVGNPGVLLRPPGPVMAATPGPTPAWGFGEKLRVNGLTNTAAGMPAPALPDEILTPGEGQVKALFVVGGNPMLAFPDQHKVQRALQSLDLLVTVDPAMSATARLGHYVIAPTLPLEVPTVSSFFEWSGNAGLIWGYDIPYSQYSPALLPKPPGSDLLDEWDFFFRLARQMGRQLSFKPLTYTHPDEAAAHAYPMDMQCDYRNEDILAMCYEDSPVPLSEVIAKGREGHVFDVPKKTVQPKPADWKGRFDIGNGIMLDELADVAATSAYSGSTEFPLLLLSRRLREHYNTRWHELDALKKKHPSNPAFMHPADMVRLGLRAGDVAEITSDTGTIYGLVAEAPELREGCVSMAHGWGVNPNEAEDPVRHGGCTSRLSSTDRDCDPYTWMARQSAIPVRIAKAAENLAKSA